MSRVADFAVGLGANAPVWRDVPWTALRRLGSGRSAYETRFKCLYAHSGLYLLVDCEDERITATSRKDGDELWREDVVEIFLWPEENKRMYFQYAVSPLGTELPLLVPSAEHPHGWSPWQYEGERRVATAIAVEGGVAEPMAAIKRWTAEIHIPLALLGGMLSSVPRKGTRWRINICRTDFDVLPASRWAWSDAIGSNSHAIDGFGALDFA